MFCPKCGRDDSPRRKFCPGCGTNLDVVTIALATGEDSIFTKVNKHLDRSVARYADHFFESSTTTEREGQVGSSWRLGERGAQFLYLSRLAPGDVFLSSDQASDAAVVHAPGFAARAE